jgi:MFS family permease
VELGANAAAIGRVSAMSGFAAAASIAVVANLIDRAGRRILLQTGAAVLLAVSVGFVAVDRVGPLLYVLHAGIGAAFVFTFNAAATLATDDAPPEHLGRIIGILGAVNMTTNAIGTVAAELVANLYGYRVLFLGAGVLGVLALALSPAIEDRQPTADERARMVPLIEAISPPLLAVLGVTALAGAAFAAMFTFHQPYAVALGAKNVAPFFVGFTLTSVAMRVFFGGLGDRHGR